jgi:uncharacterized protein
VATDVYPPPKMVKKLAATFNSKIYSPSKIMTVGSKNEMVEEYLNADFSLISHISPENAHQRDALAAAIKTYKHYEKKLNQIENRVSSLNISDNEVDIIKCLVINGTPISKAIDSFLTKKTTEDSDSGPTSKIVLISKNSKAEINEENMLKLKNRIKSQEKQIKNQESIIKNLRDKNKLLKNKFQRQKRKTSKLQSRIDKLHYDYSHDILYKKEISSKIQLIKNLQEKYNQEKDFRKQVEENLESIQKINAMEISKNSVPVKIVKSFTREGIKEASQYWRIKKGDVILLSSSIGGGSHTASLIVQIGVKAVITTDAMSHQAKAVLEEANIPIICADRLELKHVDEFAIIKDETLNNEIEKWKSNVENMRKKEEKQKLLKVIDEYKAKRKREPFNE